MIKLIYTVTLLSLSLSVFAQLNNAQKAREAVDRKMLFDQENYNKVNPRSAQEESEIYLHNQSFLSEENESTGLYTDLYYTKLDTVRLSFSYSFSHDYEEFSKLQAIDLQFMKKIPSYKDQWWGIQLKRVTAKYNALADEVQADTGHADANSNTKRFDNQQLLSMIGFGYGYRFKALTMAFKSDRIFESLMAYANYVTHVDGTDSTSYTGYGLTTEYSLQKRVSEGFFYGVKIGYNIASLERSKVSDEKKTDRSLVFKWASLGFEIGYYF